MKISNKNLLLISPEPWNHIFVSKHHYAINLVKRGNSVYFLNPPNDKFNFDETEYDGIYSINYKGFIKGLRYLPSFLQRYFIKREFIRLQNLVKVKFDIIWSFDNSVFFDFKALPSNVFCISHIVDLNQNFEFSKATKSADLCLSTSSFILDKQKIFNKQSYNIGHGYNAIEIDDNFYEINGKSEINCGYAGNLDIEYIDWRLVNNLLETFPSINFHFAGTWKSNYEYSHVLQKPNFFYYGKLKSMKLQSFYKKMDILLIVYDYQKYPKQLSNPHKMMEYLGSGKMILASWSDEYTDLHKNKTLLMSKTNKDFIDAFKELIPQLDYYNNSFNKKKRTSFALNNTYQKQISKIENMINN